MPDKLKQKYSVYFDPDQARRFAAVYADCFKRSGGRTNWSEVVKELMGYPVPENKDSLVTRENRDLISGKQSHASGPKAQNVRTRSSSYRIINGEGQ